DDRTRVTCVCNQTDICELGLAIHENHVGRFDVAVYQPVAVQMAKGLTERESNFQHSRCRQTTLLQFCPQSVGHVQIRSSNAEIRMKSETRPPKILIENQFGIVISEFFRLL